MRVRVRVGEDKVRVRVSGGNTMWTIGATRHISSPTMINLSLQRSKQTIFFTVLLRIAPLFHIILNTI